MGAELLPAIIQTLGEAGDVADSETRVRCPGAPRRSAARLPTFRPSGAGDQRRREPDREHHLQHLRPSHAPSRSVTATSAAAAHRDTSSTKG